MSPALSGAYATPLRLELVPSHRLQLLLATSHAGGLMLLPFTGLAAVFTLPLAVLLCAVIDRSLPAQRLVRGHRAPSFGPLVTSQGTLLP